MELPTALPSCLLLALQVYVPAVGERHVPFVLPSIETRAPVALSDFEGDGKPLLLIHFASW